MLEILEGSRARERVDSLVRRLEAEPPEIEPRVRAILAQVREGGDAAVIELTRRFDGASLTPETLRVSLDEIEAALRGLTSEFLHAQALAAENIQRFHALQAVPPTVARNTSGASVIMRVTPIPSVGTYIPGGKGGTTPLISTAMMTVIPARCAGVTRIVAVSPPRPDGTLDPHLVAALHLSGATEIYKIGGAQAVAALAYGTRTVSPVDKIVGPGNAYVARAKQLVMGTVDIDRINGPSEVVILAGGGADPAHIAADLLAQAEHDPMAVAVLITWERALAQAVAGELRKQAEGLPRLEIVRQSLESRGALLVVSGLAEAVDAVNRIAPEHVEVLVPDGWIVAQEITAAGAVFVGPHTPQALGDYTAGPNHTLPTGGTARFASPLGVWDFVKRTSYVTYTRAALERESLHAQHLARLEGLEAHARSIGIRTER